jgi:glycosyltransferase involved in cell wall biosynthesis
MIRVGFLLNVSTNWMGGVNYMKNLLYAINTLKDKKIEHIVDTASVGVISNKGKNNKEIEPVVFISKKMDIKLKNEFSNIIKLVEVRFMTPKSLSWLVWKITRKLFHSDFMVEFYLRKYKIDVFSHSYLIGLKKAKTINWITDFQHVHLPEMFNKKEINRRNKWFIRYSKKSDAIILSSYDALNDYKNFTKDYSDKPKVLQFVSQTGKYIQSTIDELNKLKLEFNLPNDFFFIPNQFWKHKNHIVVFKAIALLKTKGYNITMVCSGNLNDYRNIEYINQVKHFIYENKIDVRLLGVIDYNKMFQLMKYSIAVINPSFFEGWSSTVEECKSLGKNMILSNIAVHKEQNPANSFYFDPNNEEELADILLNVFENRNSLMKLYNEQEFNENIKVRTNEFALKYKSIVLSVL